MNTLAPVMTLVLVIAVVLFSLVAGRSYAKKRATEGRPVGFWMIRFRPMLQSYADSFSRPVRIVFTVLVFAILIVYAYTFDMPYLAAGFIVIPLFLLFLRLAHIPLTRVVVYGFLAALVGLLYYQFFVAPPQFVQGF